MLVFLTLQRRILAQVAGYHLGYAGQLREVEVSAEAQADSQALTKWLSGQLGREIVVPDLSDFELKFVGGRLFYVNGQPVGQIAYHDAEGRLTDFCLKRNPSKRTQSPQQSDYGNRLQLISWQDRDYQYVLVGFAPFEALEPAAERLQGIYGDDI